MADSSFGSGLGGIIGGVMAGQDIDKGSNAVDAITNTGGAMQQPYQEFGTSFLPGAQSIIGNDSSVGAGRFGANGSNVQDYNSFMQNYQASPGAQYTIQQAQQAQENSAASKGQVLSGANQRALSTVTQGVAGTQANKAYDEYLQGNNQQFGQLESVLGNMFQGIGVGQTANGQQTNLLGTDAAAQSSLAQAGAKADMSVGSGIGSLFSGIGAMAKK